MQSNFLGGTDFQLPGHNDCKVPWTHPSE